MFHIYCTYITVLLISVKYLFRMADVGVRHLVETTWSNRAFGRIHCSSILKGDNWSNFHLENATFSRFFNNNPSSS